MPNPIPAACLPERRGFDAGFRDELVRLLHWRRDVRKFRDLPVDARLLDHLLDVACLAPSVGLSQPWRFVKVDSPDRRAAIRADFAACNADALAGQSNDLTALYASLKLAGLDQAPCHLAVFAAPDPAQGHGLGRMTMPETTVFSAVIAVHTIWLAARAHGLGLGWVSILNPAIVKAALDVPAAWIFVGYLCVGYPEAEDATPALQMAGWEQRRTADTFCLQR